MTLMDLLSGVRNKSKVSTISSEESINNLLSNKDFCKMVDTWITNVSYCCNQPSQGVIQLATIESFAAFHNYLNRTPSLNITSIELFTIVKRRWEYAYKYEPADKL
ncbi:hypothetical protein PCS_01125 [Desulfocurvibacter africanus PCS]|uniref:Uncharacterized protein n=1 Tax=Desulfocurvibacter africanus PCS TaxID=1262666 RepID=M5Q398_DESAF|nr:hypothetical protein PCS_01125 [Desulfocurvibacter africanus PCS]